MSNQKIEKEMKFILKLLLITLMFCSCEDFFVHDISGDELLVNSPADTFQTTSNSIFFWWNIVKGADSYHLQIVQPDFTHVERLIIDTMVTADRYTVFLQPGQYLWRMRAINHEYQTQWVFGMLQIDSTVNLTGQLVQLLTPFDNDTTRTITHFFRWYKLYNADEYRFVIKSPDITGLELLSVKLADTLFSYTLNEGSYTWGVQALNKSSQSLFAYRSVFIDTTSPGVPQLTMPPDNAVLTNSQITFQWQHLLPGGSSVTDSVLLSGDSLFANPLQKIAVFGTSYTDSLGTGKYFWKAKSVDKAGNSSAFSTVHSFQIQ
jgi:hypothetical protein